MVSNVSVRIFKIILYHKINGTKLGGTLWQIPIITLWGKEYQFIYVGYGPYGHVIYQTTRIWEGNNVNMAVSSWGTNYTPRGKISLQLRGR
jgi:hypothetical protein